MATSTDLSGGILTEVTPPSIGSMGGGRVSTASTPSTLTQVAGAVSQLAPLALGLWNKSQTDDLQKGLSEQLLNISEARQNGDITAGEAESRFRQTVLQTKQANPDYLDEINAISMKAIGRNPVAEAEQSNRDRVLAAEQLGAILSHGTGASAEDNVELGMTEQKRLKDAERRAAALASNVAATKVRQTNFENSMIELSGASHQRLSPILGDILQASAMVNTAEGNMALTKAFNQFDATLSGIENATMSAATERLNLDAYKGIDGAAALKTLSETMKLSHDNMRKSLSHASENGYTKQLSDQVKLFEQHASISFAQAAPLIYGTTKALGPDVARALFTPETIQGMAPQMIKELNKYARTFSPVEEETTGETVNRMDAVLDILKGKGGVSQLNNPTDRGAILGTLGKVVTASVNKVGSHPQEEGDLTSEGAFLNGASELMYVAATINVTSKDNMGRVTDIITPRYVAQIDKVKDRNKADSLADTSVNVLFKEYKLLTTEAADVTTGTGEQTIEYDKTLGKVVLRKLSAADVTGRVEIDRLRRVTGTPTQADYWQAIGKSLPRQQALVDRINANVSKQWAFKQYAPAMGEAKSVNRWSEVLHQTNTKSIPYVKGQQPSTGLYQILEVGKKSQEEGQTHMSQLGKTLSGVTTNLAKINTEVATGTLFGNKKPQEPNKKRTEPYIGFNAGGGS